MPSSRTRSPEHPAAIAPSLPYAVARLDRVLRGRIELAVAPYHVTVTQYTVLSALARQPGLSSAQLARRAYVSPQSMNETLLTLEALRLVVRSPHPARRRVLTTRLSAKGVRLVHGCDHNVAEVETEMTDGMNRAQRDTLRSLMIQAVRNLGGGFPERQPEVGNDMSQVN